MKCCEFVIRPQRLESLPVGCIPATRHNRSLIGAGSETRTRDIFHGKEVLYQLSYTRIETLGRSRPPFLASHFVTRQQEYSVTLIYYLKQIRCKNQSTPGNRKLYQYDT